MLSVSEANVSDCTSALLQSSKDILNIFSLNNHLSTHSYVGGHTPTRDDESVFNMLGSKSFVEDELPHLSRWKRHILSFSVKEKQGWKVPSVFLNGDGVCGGAGLVGGFEALPKECSQVRGFGFHNASFSFLTPVFCSSQTSHVSFPLNFTSSFFFFRAYLFWCYYK